MVNEIINGDCVQIMRKMLDECIDLVVTSPPYGRMRKYADYNVFDFENAANELFRIIKRGGVIVWIVNDQYVKGSRDLSSFRQCIRFNDIGFRVHDVMIWLKPSTPFPGNVRYRQVYEFVLILSKGKPKTINLICDQENKCAGRTMKIFSHRTPDNRSDYSNPKKIARYRVRDNVWTVNPADTKDKFVYEHPAVFPEQLAADHIKSWSNPGDIVLDPFAGSGTTLKMAKSLQRNFTGIEISKKYCQIAHKRVNTI